MPQDLLNTASDIGSLTVQHQAITWTNTELLSTGYLATNFGNFLIQI